MPRRLHGYVHAYQSSNNIFQHSSAHPQDAEFLTKNLLHIHMHVRRPILAARMLSFRTKNQGQHIWTLFGRSMAFDVNEQFYPGNKTVSREWNTGYYDKWGGKYGKSHGKANNQTVIYEYFTLLPQFYTSVSMMDRSIPPN